MKIETKKHIISEKEFLNYTNEEMWHRYKYTFVGMLTFECALVGYSIWNYISMGWPSFFINWFPLILIVALWLYFVFFVMPKKMATATYTKKELIETWYTFDDEFIRQDREDGNILKFKWSSIHKVSITMKYIMIYQTPYSTVFVPLHVFESESDKNNILLKLEVCT